MRYAIGRNEMPIYIVKPEFTGEIIIRVFEHMVMCEVMKVFGHMPQMHNGLQDGYFKCLVDLFAEEPSAADISAGLGIQRIGEQKGKTYLKLVDEIIEAKLQSTIEHLAKVCNDERRDFGSLMDQLRVEGDTRRAVREYYDHHAAEMWAALRF